jgi:hypothetical protein
MAFQLTLNFEPGLAQRYKSVKACVRAQIYASAKPDKAIAADMDLSPSELSRKIADNPNDPRNLTVEDLESYIETQRDLTPIYYLLEKYGVPDEMRMAQAEAALLALLPQIEAITATLAKKVRRK